MNNLNYDKNILEDFCKKWKIKELSVFGSFLRGNFKTDSDIDILISFEDYADYSLFDFSDIQEELQVIFGRKVDLVSKRGLENSKNYLRKESILNNSKVIYAA